MTIYICLIKKRGGDINEKILRSVFVLAVALTLVAAATNAFFSDTETSKNNRFVAGAIDLTVDSEAHYNGLVCKDGEWVNDCIPVGDELIENGGFEEPEVTNAAKWEIFEVIPGWTIEWESADTFYGGQERPAPALQEYHEDVNGWSAAEGDQYAELDTDWDGPGGSLNGEPALVNIWQDISTTPGEKYELKYHFSPRPNTGSGDNTLMVRVDGSEVASHTKTGGSTVNWTMYEYEFVAVGKTTRIEFAGGGTANSLGVFLDGISLHLMECRSTFTELEGQECALTWGQPNGIDIEGQKFWNYSDVKPGDWGENTISLHVESNDAYACMSFVNLQDNDLGLTEPESDPLDGNDQTDGDGKGELSSHLEFFAWYDDGDNVWEETEELLTDVPVAGNVFLASTYEIAVPNEPLGAGVTSYLGVYWCAGEIVISGSSLSCNGEPMGNIAQTDETVVDVSFLVEQARHNEGFSCQGQVDEVRTDAAFVSEQ